MISVSLERPRPTGAHASTLMSPAGQGLSLGLRKYTGGAVGSMLHAIALHGVDYSVELQVYADGVSVFLFSASYA